MRLLDSACWYGTLPYLLGRRTMPVKWVLYWQPNQGSTVSSQILNEATQCVERINGLKEGRWKATLNYYKPMLRVFSFSLFLITSSPSSSTLILSLGIFGTDQANQSEFPRDFLGISIADQPNKYYFMIRSQRIVLEADSSIQLIMEKHQFYKSKIALFFEGFQYQLGDFRLRVGKVFPTHSDNVRGIVMEVNNV